MKTVQESLKVVTQAFNRQKIKDASRQAEELLCDLLQWQRNDLYTHSTTVLTEIQWQTCEQWLKRRLQGEPLAYIFGKVNFYGCSLMIRPTVLIPRQETEILVDKITTVLRPLSLKNKILWDICCGSGCIGITLKKKFPELEVTLVDYSAEALELAQENARLNGVTVTCLQGDLLNPLQGQKAHFIVCNPPYLSKAEYEHLERDVRDFEPELALVAGATGLEFYTRLAKELPPYLYPQAKVWLEIGYQQGEALQKIFPKRFWKETYLEKDWAGHPRFFFLENE